MKKESPMDGREFTYPCVDVETSSLAVVDMERDRMDGQIAACVLQGIVNRQSPCKIYVMNTYCYDNKGGGENQAQVAERLLHELYSDVPSERLEPSDNRDWPGFMALMEEFNEVAQGLVIWDPRLEEATIEAATTIAAQTDAIVASPRLAEALEGYELPIIEDLRKYGFGGNVECLEWLLDNWFEDANKEVAFTWSHMTTSGRSWGAANKDFVMAHGLFTFYLDIEDDEEREHYSDVIERYAPGTPVMGWTDESLANELFNKMGYFMVPFIGVENLTVHSSFPSTSASPYEPRARDVDEDSVYISFFIADGDNLLHSIVYEPDMAMRSDDFAEVSATWILNPNLIDLAPRLYDWFRAFPDNQEMGGMISDGHAGADQYSGFKFYCDLTSQYLKRSGIVTMKQMGEAEAVAWNVQPYMINSGYAGADWDHRGLDPYEYHMDNECFHIGSLELEDADTIREVSRNAPAGQPLFLNVFAGTAEEDAPAKIKKVADDLKAAEEEDGKRYVFVRSVDLAATYRAWADECNSS